MTQVIFINFECQGSNSLLVSHKSYFPEEGFSSLKDEFLLLLVRSLYFLELQQLKYFKIISEVRSEKNPTNFVLDPKTPLVKNGF